MEIGLVKLSKNISSLSTGVVTAYALFILIGLITYILAAYLVKEDFEKKTTKSWVAEEYADIFFNLFLG